MFRKLQFYIILAILSYLSLTPHPERFTDTTQDKVCHIVGYLILFLSVSIGYDFRRLYLIKLSGLFLYSISIEVIQYYVPNRSFSGLDMVANGIGLIFGWVMVVIYARLLDRGLKYKKATD